MAKLRAKHLPHRVEVRYFEGETADGEKWSEWVSDVPAYVEDKAKLVVDRRAGSATEGQEVTATTFLVLLPDPRLSPRTIIRTWAGTGRQREAEVVTAAHFDHPRAPSHVEAWRE